MISNEVGISLAVLFRITIVAVLLFSGCKQYFRQQFSAPLLQEEISRKPGILQTEVKINQYTFKAYFDKESGTGSFEILYNGQRVYSEDEYIFFLPTISEELLRSKLSPTIKDITGDGIPDLIVEHYSGGMHCCFSYSIFSLGDELKKLAYIEGGHGGFEFEDRNGDNIYELIGQDWTFAYWQTSFAYSPAPTIILRYKDNAFHLAGDLMKKPPPKPEEFERHFKGVKMEIGDSVEAAHQDPQWADGGVPSSLWSYMLDLIYTGNGQLAWKFFDKAWPDERKGKKEFLNAFKKQLSTSPYWSEIKIMNNWNK